MLCWVLWEVKDQSLSLGALGCLPSNGKAHVWRVGSTCRDDRVFCQEVRAEAGESLDSPERQMPLAF